MGANLSGAKLNRGDLRGAKLEHADLSAASLDGADLAGGPGLADPATGLTREQIAEAIVDGATKLPFYLTDQGEDTSG
jgi:uncharacterized protein YjbI with pentapeptide repeats